MASFQNTVDTTNSVVEELPFADLPVAERMRLLRSAILFPEMKAKAPTETGDHIVTLLQEWEDHSHLAVVQEQPFVSNIPFFGKFVVRFRYAWNWMSTKWWVQPMVQQQNVFNAWVLWFLREMLEVVGFLGRRDALNAEVVTLREEVRELRAQVMALKTLSVIPQDAGMQVDTQAEKSSQ
ncbi:MAG TPA: hypothetical protein PKH77_03450 [Anaerolineae bacterium]|nr:hypothetical protein [Anaerolineae bacterium]